MLFCDILSFLQRLATVLGLLLLTVASNITDRHDLTHSLILPNGLWKPCQFCFGFFFFLLFACHFTPCCDPQPCPKMCKMTHKKLKIHKHGTQNVLKVACYLNAIPWDYITWRDTKFWVNFPKYRTIIRTITLFTQIQTLNYETECYNNYETLQFILRRHLMTSSK